MAQIKKKTERKTESDEKKEIIQRMRNRKVLKWKKGKIKRARKLKKERR